MIYFLSKYACDDKDLILHNLCWNKLLTYCNLYERTKRVVLILSQLIKVGKTDRKNEAPLIGAQSGSHIYQSENEKRHFFMLVVVIGGDQLSTFDTESKNAKLPNFHFLGGGGGGQLSTFDAESKSAKIPKFHFWGWRGGGRLVTTSKSHLLPVASVVLTSVALLSANGAIKSTLYSFPSIATGSNFLTLSK